MDINAMWRGRGEEEKKKRARERHGEKRKMINYYTFSSTDTPHTFTWAQFYRFRDQLGFSIINLWNFSLTIHPHQEEKTVGWRGRGRGRWKKDNDVRREWGEQKEEEKKVGIMPHNRIRMFLRGLWRRNQKERNKKRSFRGCRHFQCEAEDCFMCLSSDISPAFLQHRLRPKTWRGTLILCSHPTHWFYIPSP